MHRDAEPLGEAEIEEPRARNSDVDGVSGPGARRARETCQRVRGIRVTRQPDAETLRRLIAR
jgi:hypothetical protein